MDADFILLSEFIALLEGRLGHSIDVKITAKGGFCEVTLYEPEELGSLNPNSLRFGVVRRAGMHQQWAFDRQQLMEKLQWAIENYHDIRANGWQKLYEQLKEAK